MHCHCGRDGGDQQRAYGVEKFGTHHRIPSNRSLSADANGSTSSPSGPRMSTVPPPPLAPPKYAICASHVGSGPISASTPPPSTFKSYEMFRAFTLSDGDSRISLRILSRPCVAHYTTTGRTPFCTLSGIRARSNERVRSSYASTETVTQPPPRR